MAKKKDKPQVINNIQELNLEIDYDKLAEAIVKAQEKSETEANRNKKFTSSVLALIVIFTLRIVSVFGWILVATMPFAIVNMAQSLIWNEFGNIVSNVFIIVFAISMLIFIGLYSVLLWKSAKEIDSEKDRNYIISIFSGIVSFAALIVALVALFKGVG